MNREKKKAAEKSKYLCLAPIFAACVPGSGRQQASGADDARNRLSFSFMDGRAGGAGTGEKEEQRSESIIDPAASIVARKDDGDGRHCAVIVGTIFGTRAGRVTFSVQRDAAVPPPFLFELSVPMQSLAAEMGSGTLRIALECHRSTSSTTSANGGGATGGTWRNVWTASCNGRDVGHAVRRRPRDWERAVLESMRAMTAGVGAMPPPAESEAPEGTDEHGSGGGGRGGGEVLYMRATYERIVGSKDAVSYHLISPRTAAGGSPPPQELSVFLMRTRDN